VTAVQDPVLQAVGLVVSMVGTFGIAAVGTRATLRSLNTWYVTLRKPVWVPSGRTIGMVWTVLYFVMAVAAWLVWRDLGSDAWLPLALYAAQLTLNALWSVLFFARRDPQAAFLGIVALWGAILATLVSFWTATLWAGVLFVPYLAWVTFAGNLNRIVAKMNPKAA
jgi:benzodiazapine receptor